MADSSRLKRICSNSQRIDLTGEESGAAGRKDRKKYSEEGLGKRSALSELCGDKKESGPKSRMERIQDIEDRFKMLCGNKGSQEETKVISSSDESLNETTALEDSRQSGLSGASTKDTSLTDHSSSGINNQNIAPRPFFKKPEPYVKQPNMSNPYKHQPKHSASNSSGQSSRQGGHPRKVLVQARSANGRGEERRSDGNNGGISVESNTKSYGLGTNLQATPIISAKHYPDPSTKLTYRAYAAKTNNGLHRKYNEDRVSIIQKIFVDVCQPFPISYFSLFDGHSGITCADYLRDSLHKYIVKQACFKEDKKRAIREGIIECEKKYLEHALNIRDKSGACLLMALFDESTVYVANVGDSRAVWSKNKGRTSLKITTDHKPEEEGEKSRIFKHGGHIFRSKKISFRECVKMVPEDEELAQQVYKEASEKGCKPQDIQDIALKESSFDQTQDIRYGPFRVEPGGLSVSRTIGDLPAKHPMYKGNPNCIIPNPDIFELAVDSVSDFIVMACDGVFDVLTTEEVTTAVWDALSKYTRSKGLEGASRIASEMVMKLAFDKKSMDNITVIVIALQDELYYL